MIENDLREKAFDIVELIHQILLLNKQTSLKVIRNSEPVHEFTLVTNQYKYVITIYRLYDNVWWKMPWGTYDIIINIVGLFRLIINNKKISVRESYESSIVGNPIEYQLDIDFWEKHIMIIENELLRLKLLTS